MHGKQVYIARVEAADMEAIEVVIAAKSANAVKRMANAIVADGGLGTAPLTVTNITPTTIYIDQKEGYAYERNVPFRQVWVTFDADCVATYERGSE